MHKDNKTDFGKRDNPTGFGRYVELREAGGWPPRYYWTLPDEVRPAGWPKSIALPTRTPSQLGKTREQTIEIDASRLNADLDLELAKLAPEGKALAHVARGWLASDRWRDLSEERKRTSYNRLNMLLRWSLEEGHPEMGSIRLSKIEEFLRRYDDRPSLKTDLRSLLNVLFVRAWAEGYIDRNPMDAIKWTVPACQTYAWTEPELRTVMATAHSLGLAGLSGVIFAMWTTGQRLGDVCRFRHDIEYKDGYLVFQQSKTKRNMRIPVSPELAAEIEASRTESSYLFTDSRGKAFSPRSLSERWRRVKRLLNFPNASQLHVRSLRHSCVMRLAKAGATVLQIAGLTGHKIVTVTRMIEHYFGADEELTRQAVKLDLVYSGKDPCDLPEVVSRFEVLANDNAWNDQPEPQKNRRRRR